MFEKLVFGFRTKVLENFNRKFFKYRKCKDNDYNDNDYMFPRVYSAKYNFTGIEMTMFTKFDASSIEPELLTNIHDKFVRVTDPNVDESKRYSARNRRSDREEIRRRLAMGAEENCNEPPQQQTQQQSERNLWKPSIQSRLQNDFTRITDLSSDTESHSSDSETCPKLSKSKSQIGMFPFNGGQLPATVAASVTATATTDNQQLHPYHGRPLSVSISTSSNINSNNNNNNATTLTQQHHQQLQQQLTETFSNEDRECDFFTKQAKLQIEARMALSQAKEMAHMQMEIERQNQRVSPITAIIRHSLDKVGVQIKPDKRRLSRQLLTDMNIAQLQILVNNLHTHIEDLNESLVNYLMERDDLHDSQDTMLVDIEELTRFIGAKEHIAQQERISSVNKCSK